MASRPRCKTCFHLHFGLRSFSAQHFNVLFFSEEYNQTHFPLQAPFCKCCHCGPRHRRLTQEKPGWHFTPEEENFIRNFRFPTGVPVLTSLPMAQYDHIWHCKITNCFFITAPLLSTHKTMGKCSSLNIYFRQWENMLILLKHPFWGTTGSKNAHHSLSNCNDGVTWWLARKMRALFSGHCIALGLSHGK